MRVLTTSLRCPVIALFALFSLAGQDRGVRVKEAPIGPAGPDGKFYAVLFAGDQYAEWPALQNPIFDAGEVERMLREQYGFETTFIKNPAKADFASKLGALKEQAFGPNDELLVFVAGHGTYDDIENTGYLVARDSKRTDPLHDSYLSETQLLNVLSGIKCRHVLVVIDACFSGAIAMRGGDPKTDIKYPRPAANWMLEAAWLHRRVAVDRLREIRRDIKYPAGRQTSSQEERSAQPVVPHIGRQAIRAGRAAGLSFPLCFSIYTRAEKRRRRSGRDCYIPRYHWIRRSGSGRAATALWLVSGSGPFERFLVNRQAGGSQRGHDRRKSECEFARSRAAAGCGSETPGRRSGAGIPHHHCPRHAEGTRRRHGYRQCKTVRPATPLRGTVVVQQVCWSNALSRGSAGGVVFSRRRSASGATPTSRMLEYTPRRAFWLAASLMSGRHHQRAGRLRMVRQLRNCPRD